MVEEIISGFPNPALPKIDNEPTLKDIKVTTSLLNENAISVMVGGGAHDHLGILITQVEYAVISATSWVEPYNTKAIPIIPPETNAVDVYQIARMYDEFRQINTNRINVYHSLKRIILEAYDNMYTSHLEDYLLQYVNRSDLEILMHLKEIYDFINPT
jgi:hypothetical protein